MPLNANQSLRRTEFVALIAALMALNSLAIDIMLPALPAMGNAFGLTTENERQFVIMSYMIGYGLGELVFGPLSDRFGRKVPLLLGVAVYAVAATLAILSPNFAVLLALRLIQGIGAASTRVIAISIVRDLFAGSAMAEVMSMSFVVLMAVPILAPGMGQALLFLGPWQLIFCSMSALGLGVGVWVLARLPETLDPGRRRSLDPRVILDGFRIVVSDRTAFAYGLAGMFLFASLFGFLTSAQQIYVDIYGLGVYFPVAFAAVAALMGLSSFTNSRIVASVGMRRVSHGALLVLTVTSGLWLILAITMDVPFWLFLPLLAIIMSCFGWAASNMNSLSMEPLGAVAGTASSVFGFIQTVGGAVIGGIIGQMFNGTVIPVATGYFSMGILCLLCVLVAEHGRLFGGHNTAPHRLGQESEASPL